jgi:diaminobutyrate-2-oxoglutarate transaminase
MIMTLTGPTACTPSPRVRGELPGPRSAELLARQHLREPTRGGQLPIAVDRGTGSFVHDLDGNVFIDFLSGAGLLALGHSHPELVEVATAQLGRSSHGLGLPSAAEDAFVEAQLSMLPGRMAERTKVHLCGPTGAGAVDAAITLCKTATGRGDVVSFQGGSHGTAHAGVALSGLVADKAPIRNGVPGVHFLPFSNCSDCPLGLNRDGCDTNCATLIERSLRDPNGGITRPAAVLLELVQAEGGVVPADPEFVRRIRELTRELDIPLVVDEVQTGCGRTGTWFAFEQYGIEPDIVVASNALSGIGQPLALIMYDQRLDVWTPGPHTGAFRGTQVAFATGTRTVEIVRRDDVLGNVRAREAQIDRQLAVLREHPWVRGVRGRGLMWGVELAHPGTGRRAGAEAERVQAHALRHGLIVELGGRDDCVLRMLPPLNVTADVVDTACRILVDAVEQVTGTPAGPRPSVVPVPRATRA